MNKYSAVVARTYPLLEELNTCDKENIPLGTDAEAFL